VAPEQAAGAGRQVGPHSDQYAAAVVLYELLTGGLPFEGAAQVVLFNVVHGEVPPPSSLRPGLDPALEAICLRALAKEPAARFPSAAAFAEALRGWLAKASLAEVPPTAARPARRSPSRPGGESEKPAHPVGKRKQGDEATAEQAPRRRSGLRLWLGLAAPLALVAVVVALVVGLRTGGSSPRGEMVAPDDNAFTNSIGMRFASIPATGKKGFWMGSDEKDEGAFENEIPRHRVLLTKDFFVGVTEVTQKQYRAVMNKNPSYFCAEGGGKDKVNGWDTDDFPVEQVSWEDAQEFLEKLNALAPEQKFKVRYRLPTEAEWEYSCRGGADVKDPFTFKKPATSISSALANFNGNLPFGGADKDKYLGRTTAVGSYYANPFGLHDMHGNVWEWCQDCYTANVYTKQTRIDPIAPEKDGPGRVIRGGCWNNVGLGCRSANRSWHAPSGQNLYLGFRVVAVPHE
jgi:formylglycine-generating enzyme required for sulfatase activity